MPKIKLFISHASQDKKFAGKVKKCFEAICDFEAFCAHDDIPVAEDFHDELLVKMNEADVVIALISRNFSKSTYANQEIGMAIASNKKIIPVKLDSTNPPGFIDKLQAFKCKSDENYVLHELVTTTFFILYKSKTYIENKENIVNLVINAFLKSNSFDNSNGIIDILLKIKLFNNKQIQLIINAIKSNSQIYNKYYQAHALKRLLNLLKTNYDIDIRL